MIPRRAGKRIKTDRIDARNLARLHRAGELTAIRVPTPAEEGLLFGDRVSTDPAVWELGDPHYDDLAMGQGRLLAEQIAEQLGGVIVPSWNCRGLVEPDERKNSHKPGNR